MLTFLYSSQPFCFLSHPLPFRVFGLCLGGDGDCLIQWALQVRKYHGQELELDGRK